MKILCKKERASFACNMPRSLRQPGKVSRAYLPLGRVQLCCQILVLALSLRMKLFLIIQIGTKQFELTLKYENKDEKISKFPPKIWQTILHKFKFALANKSCNPFSVVSVRISTQRGFEPLILSAAIYRCKLAYIQESNACLFILLFRVQFSSDCFHLQLQLFNLLSKSFSCFELSSFEIILDVESNNAQK